MAGVVLEDVYNHRNPSGAANLTAGAVSTTAAGTIAPTTSAGASPTVTFATGQVANDNYGSFTLNPVTGGGAQAAGAVAVVTFANAFGRPPAAIMVNCMDDAGPVSINAKAVSITAAGFSVSTPILTTAHTYTVTYHVLP
jgi:hypothetical protein